jgi:hypothetical protein
MRARNIKPGLYSDKKLLKCSLGASFLFPALWMIADREGRLVDDPEQIEIDSFFVVRNLKADPLLQELHDNKIITRYTAGGKKYIQINNFGKHQKPHPNERPSEIPEPVIKLHEQSLNYTSNPSESLNPESLNPESHINSASGDAAFYLTKKGRKLKGKALEDFELFWKRFNYKKGKAEAADAWYDLKPDTGTTGQILEAATREAMQRPALEAAGKTPKMAQGWLTARRWEDEYEQPKANNGAWNRRLA